MCSSYHIHLSHTKSTCYLKALYSHANAQPTHQIHISFHTKHINLSSKYPIIHTKSLVHAYKSNSIHPQVKSQSLEQICIILAQAIGSPHSSDRVPSLKLDSPHMGESSNRWYSASLRVLA